MNNEIIFGFDDEQDDSLKIELEKVNTRYLILQLDGYIDTYNFLYFQTQVSKAIAEGYLQLIFDCTKLTYVSSTGIGSFSIFLKTIKPRGGNVVLVNVKPKVYDVFHLLGFSQFFPIKDSIAEAIAFLESKYQQAPLDLFPKILTCPFCEHKLNIKRPGRYRCANCKTILAVNNNAEIHLS
ncbi:MAG: STAS domain-containing protein [Treponemataceae bacterium]